MDSNKWHVTNRLQPIGAPDPQPIVCKTRSCVLFSCYVTGDD